MQGGVLCGTKFALQKSQQRGPLSKFHTLPVRDFVRTMFELLPFRPRQNTSVKQRLTDGLQT